MNRVTGSPADDGLPPNPAPWFSFPPVLPSFDVLSLVAFETLRVSVPTLLEVPFGLVTVDVCNERLDQWSRNIVAHAKIDLRIEGAENIRADESFIVMSNHQSHFDIPVLFQALKVPLRMVAKKELYKIPVMSHAMRVAGFVELDRSNRQAAINQLRRVGSELHQSISLWIAPEGTRSLDGRLAPFKKGGFYLAEDLGLRILPIAINGTRNVLPAHGLRVTRHQKVTVRVTPPVDPRAYGGNREEVVRAVRDAINSGLDAGYRS
jgi:1-acyl-sn-glycerol-3-phosphate acyltransferase